MILTEGMCNRWAVSDGPVSIAYPGEGDTVEVACGDRTETATVSLGVATLTAAQALALMPSVGVFSLDFGGIPADVERVGARYCSKADVIAYGDRNGDGFDNAARYPDEAFQTAIQAAEEAIEEGTGRSFCRRAATVHLLPGLNELPFEDAIATTEGTLLHGRQVRIDSEADAEVTYGALFDQRIRAAATMLAASYLRPRVGAENVRGASMDGVYVSYTLATGEEGSETGLPEVDAIIAAHRSHRSVVM